MHRALIFAAALILGFSLFVEKDINIETEAMFTGACDIMSLFSIGSPQASRYHKIMMHLAQTIARQRQKAVLCHGRPENRESLGTLFRHQHNSVNLVDSLPTPSETADSAPRHDSGQSGTTEQFNGWPSQDGIDTSLSGDVVVDPAFYGWDSLHLSLWDSFPFFE